MGGAMLVKAFSVLFAGVVSALPSQIDDVHPARVAQIKAIQSTPGVTWVAAAHPRFASDAPGASKSLLGVKGNWSEVIEKAVTRGQMVRLLHDPETAIPDSFDSATNWPHCAKVIGDIRDQSNCGCCWAFAGAEAGSDRMCIATSWEDDGSAL